MINGSEDITLNVYPVVAPQKIEPPYIIYQLVDIRPYDTKTGVSQLDEEIYQLTVWGDVEDISLLETQSRLLRTLFDRYTDNGVSDSGVLIDSVQYLTTSTTTSIDGEMMGIIQTYKFRIKI